MGKRYPLENNRLTGCGKDSLIGGCSCRTEALHGLLDAHVGLDADKLAAEWQKAGRAKILAAAFDRHTQKGRKMGKSKAEFTATSKRRWRLFPPGLRRSHLELDLLPLVPGKGAKFPPKL